MRVTLFARVDTALNPYLLLYRQALESQGLSVRLEGEVSLAWLARAGKDCDALHLHWIEAAYRPVKRARRSGLMKKLLNNRFVRPIRGALRLANFATTLLLARWRGKTIVYTVHNLRAHNQEPWAFRQLNHVAQRVVFALAHRVHVHNDYARQTLQATYRRTRGVSVIPHGNYIGCYPNQMSRAEARRQLDLAADAFVYLFLGLLRPYKGVEDLIDAFGQLAGARGQLLLVGRTSNPRYEEIIRRLSGNNPAIRLLPQFVPDEALQLYFNACDVCALPYKDVTTSGAALLALSFGRPVIVPAIGSFPELITPESGMLYDPAAPEALVSALRQAERQPWSEDHILDDARRYDWHKLAPQLADLYQKEPV